MRKAKKNHVGLVLKADEEDPEPYFWIHPGTAELQPDPRLDAAGEDRARQTIRICDLNRGALLFQRLELLERVRLWVRRSRSGKDKHVNAEWRRFSDPRTQFKFVIRYTLRLYGFDGKAAEDKRRFEARH